MQRILPLDLRPRVGDRTFRESWVDLWFALRHAEGDVDDAMAIYERLDRMIDEHSIDASSKEPKPKAAAQGA